MMFQWFEVYQDTISGRVAQNQDAAGSILRGTCRLQEQQANDVPLVDVFIPLKWKQPHLAPPTGPTAAGHFGIRGSTPTSASSTHCQRRHMAPLPMGPKQQVQAVPPLRPHGPETTGVQRGEGDRSLAGPGRWDSADSGAGRAPSPAGCSSQKHVCCP